MSDKAKTDKGKTDKARDKELRKMRRSLSRAQERLVDYEQLVDRTQHLLNTRIGELEQARAELRERSAELEESEQRFRQLTEAAFETILIHEDGVIVDCNDAATQLYGMSREKLIGTRLIDRVQDSFRKQTRTHLKKSLEHSMEMAHLRSDGSAIPVETRSKPVIFHGHQALVTAVRDITEHKTLQARLERLASTDALTGVGNRRSFMEAGKREYFRSLRYGHALSLMMLDADHFKRINDTYGHEIGDVALKKMASVCQESLRGSDVFARIGGEEFAAVLPSTGLAGAVELANRVRKRIKAARIKTSQGVLQFTISIGVAVLRPDDADIDSILNRADKALYDAKTGGRDRVSAAE